MPFGVANDVVKVDSFMGRTVLVVGGGAFATEAARVGSGLGRGSSARNVGAHKE